MEALFFVVFVEGGRKQRDILQQFCGLKTTKFKATKYHRIIVKWKCIKTKQVQSRKHKPKSEAGNLFATTFFFHNSYLFIARELIRLHASRMRTFLYRRDKEWKPQTVVLSAAQKKGRLKAVFKCVRGFLANLLVEKGNVANGSGIAGVFEILSLIFHGKLELESRFCRKLTETQFSVSKFSFKAHFDLQSNKLRNKNY